MDESTKRCTGCGLVKALTEFRKAAHGLLGRRSRCKACDREYSRRYREANQEAVRESQRRYREANRETLREYNRQYREDEAYREAEREKSRQYYADNREAVLERKRRWHEANPEVRRRYREENREARQTTEQLRRAHLQALVFNHYGWACACCGSTADLSIDHVNGGGKAHREAVFGRNCVSTELYRWLIEQGFPPGYQTLCKPCNGSKANGDRCRLAHSA